MFTAADREATRGQLMLAAAGDPDITAAAHTGSFVAGAADRWSDIDMALHVPGDLSATISRWTRLLTDEYGAVHHWDLIAGRTVYRVFLLASGLEVDIAFAPTGEFGAGGPNWRLAFGTEAVGERADRPPDNTVGLCWHHLLHATACIDRGRPWEAEWLLSQAAHHVLEMACARNGLPPVFGRGTDRLPEEIKERAAAGLVANLQTGELCRALAATTHAFLTELGMSDPTLAEVLHRLLAEAIAALDGPA